MDNKPKKIILISSMVLIFISISSFFYMINIPQHLQYKSGTYFWKIHIVNGNNTKVVKWDVGISKNNTKSSIIENELNRETLGKFRNTINDISKKRVDIFLLIPYLIFVLIVFASVQKHIQIYKDQNNKKYFQLFMILLIIFLIYKIIISLVELNGLYKDINYYFNLIS